MRAGGSATATLRGQPCLLSLTNRSAAKEKTSVSRGYGVLISRKNKKVRMSSRIDLADALRKKNRRSVHSHFMAAMAMGITCWIICTVLITGGGMKPRWTGTVWQELPVMSASVCALLKRNVLLGCDIRTRCFPGRISRRWRWDGLCS